MRRVELWFIAGVVLIAAGAAVLLARPEFTTVDSRELQHYWMRHYWLCAFNALSATCGAGLLTWDFNAGFTRQGQWTLTAAGAAGALLYLLALLRIVRTGNGPSSGGRGPSVPGVVLGLVSLIAIGAAGALPTLGGDKFADQASIALMRGTAGAASLGWMPGGASQPALIELAIVGWLGALGWSVWLLPAASWRRVAPVRLILRSAAVYSVVLVAAGALVALLETPRWVQRGFDPASRGGQSFVERLPRAVLRSVLAGTAGIPAGGSGEQPASEASRMVLGGLALIGGLIGSPTGGIKWPMFLAALSAIGLVVRRPAGRVETRSQVVAVAGLMVMLLLVTIVTCGLLGFEGLSGSAFERPPSFGEAFLDAASAVGGAGLTGGLTARVTSPNLSAGMQHGVEYYQYGAAWLMLAMLLGRALPLLILRRLAEPQAPAAPRS